MIEALQIVGNRYQLQKRLGRTATNRQTWLSSDLKNNCEPVIVKLLAFSPEMHIDELKLFEREAQVLQTLNHLRIPRYRDYFSIDSNIAWFGLAQDYIPGTSLQDLLDRGNRFTEHQTRQVAANVLRILRYLHERETPVLHRDLKPSNLVLGQDKFIYLVDFGAVQDAVAITGMSFTVVGSCGYTPLEQFWGRAVPVSDLYALGATLMHLLSGIVPMDLPQLKGRLQLPNTVDSQPAFKQWLETLVNPAQEERFPSARMALEALKSTERAPSEPIQPAPAQAAKTEFLPALQRLPQPKDSSLTVNKSQSQLEVSRPLSARHLGTGTVRFILERDRFHIYSSLFGLPWKQKQTRYFVRKPRVRVILFKEWHSRGGIHLTFDEIFPPPPNSKSHNIHSFRHKCAVMTDLPLNECEWLVQEIQNWQQQFD